MKRRDNSNGAHINTLRPRQHGRHFADDTFKRIFLNENVTTSIKISLKFVPKCPNNNIPALVQIMAWRRPGDKPLSEPMMVRLLTHICVTRPQWPYTRPQWPYTLVKNGFWTIPCTYHTYVYMACWPFSICFCITETDGWMYKVLSGNELKKRQLVTLKISTVVYKFVR